MAFPFDNRPLCVDDYGRLIKRMNTMYGISLWSGIVFTYIPRCEHQFAAKLIPECYSGAGYYSSGYNEQSCGTSRIAERCERKGGMCRHNAKRALGLDPIRDFGALLEIRTVCEPVPRPCRSVGQFELCKLLVTVSNNYQFGSNHSWGVGRGG